MSVPTTLVAVSLWHMLGDLNTGDCSEVVGGGDIAIMEEVGSSKFVAHAWGCKHRRVQ